MATTTKRLKRVRVDHWFTPPEARTIASQFRAQARVIREQAGAIRKAKGTLDISWEGRSKNNFDTLIDPVPGNLDAFAQWLEGKASEIERLQALEYRYEWRVEG